MLLLTIRKFPIVLSLTGSWSDRTGVVDIRVVQVAVVIDNEHISIAAVEISRRERPKRKTHKTINKKRKARTGIVLILIYSLY